MLGYEDHGGYEFVVLWVQSMSSDGPRPTENDDRAAEQFSHLFVEAGVQKRMMKHHMSRPDDCVPNKRSYREGFEKMSPGFVAGVNWRYGRRVRVRSGERKERR